MKNNSENEKFYLAVSEKTFIFAAKMKEGEKRGEKKTKRGKTKEENIKDKRQKI